ITPVFRAILILPYAIPSILTLKVWQNLLNGSTGVINKTLKELGIISKNIYWLNDTILVKIVCIVINMWVGVPYFMLLITGQMTAISSDVFEAATIDGANKFQIFKSITLPLVLYQTIPLVIMSFTHNINNFGAIYFLTGGDPKVADSTTTGAGATDLLVTWIYKLTMNELKYCNASVLAMLVFVVMAPFAIFNFRNTKSYKEGEL
ncbi:MAG: sugar ABC transporter permease, partial [Lachnospiraceae bacterium]|nr:sugar ABC transporter permease [Lachnospiraceae bacterium]